MLEPITMVAGGGANIHRDGWRERVAGVDSYAVLPLTAPDAGALPRNAGCHGRRRAVRTLTVVSYLWSLVLREPFLLPRVPATPFPTYGSLSAYLPCTIESV